MTHAAVGPHLALPDQAELPRDEMLRVVIADGDGLARSMMKTTLRDTQGIAVVATTGSAGDLLELVRYYRPTVLIVDTGLLRDRGVKLVSNLRAVSPGTCVLTISIADDHTALDALRAGAVGHISKDIDPRKLAGLVARAARGEAIVPRRLVMPLLEWLPELPDGGWRPLHSRLTTREWEIIALLDEDASTQDMAERLVLSVSTVYSHIKSVLRKLGVHSRRDAVLAAHRLRRAEANREKAPQLSRSKSPLSVTPEGNAGGDRDISAAAGSRFWSAAERAGQRH
jgi:two-component system, NarL family, response regulator LiaR